MTLADEESMPASGEGSSTLLLAHAQLSRATIPGAHRRPRASRRVLSASPYPTVWIDSGGGGLSLSESHWSIIVSWIAPGSRHPAIELIWQISEPVMAPVRSLLPNMGGIDFSPILVFIGINVVQIGLRHAALTVGLPPGLVFGL